jgi:hypothetical protein
LLLTEEKAKLMSQLEGTYRRIVCKGTDGEVDKIMSVKYSEPKNLMYGPDIDRKEHKKAEMWKRQDLKNL